MSYFTVNTEREAIIGYANAHPKTIKYFEFDGLKGFVAFDIFCTENPEFLFDLCCAHLDKSKGINGKGEDWPPLPEMA